MGGGKGRRAEEGEFEKKGPKEKLADVPRFMQYVPVPVKMSLIRRERQQQQLQHSSNIRSWRGRGNENNVLALQAVASTRLMTRLNSQPVKPSIPLLTITFPMALASSS